MDIFQAEVPAHYAIIVVTGPYDNGQSSLLKAVSDRVWTDVEVTTKSGGYSLFSLGKRAIDADTALILIETPGPLDWWSVLDHNGLLKSMIGVVLVVDSSRPENFRAANAILRIQVTFNGASCIIAANRQDHPEAWPIEDLQP